MTNAKETQKKGSPVMKRRTAALLALLLAALMLFAACKPSSGKPEETNAPKSETTEENTGAPSGETGAETSGSETKPAETTGEKEPGETGAETKAPETRPSETEPAETEPAETEPKETEPSDPGSDPEPSAEDLAAAVVRVMKAQKEYYTDRSVYMNFIASGLSSDGFIYQEYACADIGTDDAFLYRSESSEIEIPDIGYAQKTGLYEAFSHGNRYAITLLASGSESVWTREAAAFPMIDPNETDVSDLFDCENVEAEKDEEGSLFFALSGFSSADFKNAAAEFTAQVGADVTDAEIYVYTDSEFRVTKAKIYYVFEDIGEDTPDVWVEVTYSDYDSVNPADLMDIDSDEYYDVIPDSEAAAALAMFNDRLNADKNAIALEIDQNVTTGGETAHYGESSAAIYQRTADGLSITCYTVYGENGENEGEIYYENGTRTVVQNGQTVDLSWTEEEAEAFICGAMQPVPFGTPAIASKDPDGWLCFAYDSIEKEALNAMMGKLSASPTDSSLVIFLEIKDGTIASAEFCIWAKGYIGLDEVTLEMDYGVLFDNYEFFEG